MKILFYVEPHPIRNELVHHRSILLSKWGDKIIQWNENGSDLQCMIATHHFGYSLAILHKKELVPFILPTNMQEESLIQENLQFWNEGSILRWCELMKGRKHESFLVYESYLERIKRNHFDFDVVVIWGINGFIFDVAKKLNTVPLAMELSSIRSPFPPSIYLDSKGVNGSCSVSGLTIEYMRSKNSCLREPVEIFDSYNSDNPLSDVIFWDRRYDFISSRVKELNKVILIPLQIGDDSNILIGSSYNSAFEFVEDVIKIFEDTDFTLIFKPHPGAKSRGGVVYLDHKKCEDLVSVNSNCIWFEDKVDKEEYLPFIAQFDGVVTINSSVGFEAMLLGVPVFPLGEAIYKPKDYIFDKYEIPKILNVSKQEFIDMGKIISKFILNTVFCSDDKLTNNPDIFKELVLLHSNCYSNQEELYDDILNKINCW